MNPKLDISRSNIDGFGVFAKQNFDRGEILVVQCGRIVRQSELSNPANIPFSYVGFQIKLDFYLFPLTVNEKPVLDGIFRVNHSCSPNAGFSDSITLVSIRPITKGEEVCFDYAMTDVSTGETKWDDMECRCNTPNCRKKSLEVTGSYRISSVAIRVISPRMLPWKLPNYREITVPSRQCRAMTNTEYDRKR